MASFLVMPDRTRGWRTEIAPRDPALAVAALIALALTAGGGGVSAAFGNLAVQLAALLLFAVFARDAGGFIRHGPRTLAILVITSCLLPLVQLVPMPPSWWASLPGRDLVAKSFDLAGGRGWFPLSVAPGRTLLAFLGTLAPAAIIAVGCGLRPDRLVWLQWVMVGATLSIALFGATHLVNDRWGDLYAGQQPLPGVLVGTFADRNAAALLLIAGLLLLIGVPVAPRTPVQMSLHFSAGIFLLLCIVLTGSRTGMILIGAPALLLVGRVASARGRRRLVGLALGVAIVAVASLAVLSTGRGQASLSRFEDNDGMRAEMREDARFAAAHYWPVGTGMGTFDEVFQIDESLEYVSPRRAGRAHMDYLELAIEAGLAGLVLAAAWAGWVAWQAWRATRCPGAWPARAAGLIVATIAAQSLLSFPLRSQAMLCVAAFAIVLLARSPVAAADAPDAERPR